MKGMNCNEKYILHIENSRAEPVIWENLGKYGGTDMLGTYKIRTDLAVEARERFTEDNVEVLSLIHISEPTRHGVPSRMPSSA